MRGNNLKIRPCIMLIHGKILFVLKSNILLNNINRYWYYKVCIQVGRENEKHKLLQYNLSGVDWVAVRWCPLRSDIIREPLKVGPERLL